MKNDKWNYDNIDYEWLFICRIGLKNYIFTRAKIIGTKYRWNLKASSHENLFGCTKLKKKKKVQWYKTQSNINMWKIDRHLCHI